ncbi:hypothetical protein M3Y98_00437400 [Aphelenchoides besseyi]|nr:hypothetical protein M3Y98_00437400 [Aphelenchoides besseyi]
MICGRKREAANNVTLASTFNSDKVASIQTPTIRIRNPCFMQIKQLFGVRSQNTFTSTTHSRRRRHRTEDCRFIEQRIDSSNSEDDDAATNKTNSTTVTYLSSSSNRVAPFQPRSSLGNRQYPRSFFRIALDYNRRIEEVGVKNRKTEKANDKLPQFPFQNSLPTTPQEAAILHHTSRRDFLQSTSHTSTPPTFRRRALTPTRISLTDTVSENSFIVVHNTLKVAWEKEIYPERIQEVKRFNRLRNSQIRWHSVDSTCTESEESNDGADPTEACRNQRIEWSQQLQEIVPLD